MTNFNLKNFSGLAETARKLPLNLIVFGFRYGADTIFDCGWAVENLQEGTKINGSLYPTTDLAKLYDLIGYAYKYGGLSPIDLQLFFCDEENVLYSPTRKGYIIKNYHTLTLVEPDIYAHRGVYDKISAGLESAVR